MNHQDSTLLDDSTLAEVQGGATTRTLYRVDSKGFANAAKLYANAFKDTKLVRDLGLKLDASLLDRVRFDPRAIGGSNPI